MSKRKVNAKYRMFETLTQDGHDWLAANVFISNWERTGDSFSLPKDSASLMTADMEAVGLVMHEDFTVWEGTA
jgi:acid phosphatase class B